MGESVLVLLAASHAALRTSLATMVGSDARFGLVVLPVDEHRCILAAAAEHQPPILLLAVKDALANGGELIREVRRCSPVTAVVLAASFAGEAYARAARTAGAAAYVPLERLGPELLETLLETAAAGETG